ncbi:MAG TPA: Na+/H+ antiporter subunit E [Thermoanaerobaculia bacterium]|nr:Na+/H+ antiporter subunit E [Thermoanaerobaculia bacterium]HPA51818.1 Na+/H+ antiporter subunit E [Thermoanaerobaculia bacterium]HQN07734.1 Na+/H+ antiporter subunit E [Thermoanaerobaculia bacterium]HQP86304.1 Na+/H+ antiporter subunit E [Thermoanaerobaculia bacterium]
MGTFAFLVFAWVAVTGEVSVANLLEGAVLAGLLVLVLRVPLRRRFRLEKVPKALGLLLYFLKELLLSNAAVARILLSPASSLSPGIVAVPLDLKSDAGITVLANLVTLTPGTLSLDVSPDRTTLYVHALHVDDPDAFRREVKEGFERRVKEVFE